MEFDKSSQQCAMHAATGRVRASLPPPPILVCAIVKIKSTQHFGLVLRQRPKWKTPLLQGGSHTTDNIDSCVALRAQLGRLGGSRWGWVLQIKFP